MLIQRMVQFVAGRTIQLPIAKGNIFIDRFCELPYGKETRNNYQKDCLKSAILLKVKKDAGIIRNFSEFHQEIDRNFSGSGHSDSISTA